MTTSANIFVNVIPKKEYIPENSESVIYQLHCTKTNECPIKIWNFHNSTPMEFPPGSFVQGAVYPIVVFKMEFDDNMASFIGYRTTSNNIPNYLPRNWHRTYNRK